MNIFESITNIMQESIAIGKDKMNTQQKFKYRGIDDVMNTFYPLLSKHKVFVVPEVVEQIREERLSKQGGNLIYSILKIKYTFYAEDGSNVSAVVIGEGMDSADKASNKAMAVGMKYAMFQVFCIPTEEMPDSDSETPPPSTPKNKEDKVEEQPKVEVMTLEKAKETTFEVKGAIYKVGECSNEQLFYLRDNIKDEELLDAVSLVLMDKAKTGNITNENHD